MLQEIINLQRTTVDALVKELETSKKEITFKAPTGSGKTYMMADFMNRVLDKYSNRIFIMSSLSKGDLARQNYEKFVEYKDKGDFTKLEPYLINSDIANEERLYIPLEYNVYVLPRDLYKKGSRLMEGAMTSFLDNFLMKKEIILIRDECHIATTNLDNIPFPNIKIINFSATPNIKRGQHPDVEIKVEDAENCKLIKTIEWGANTDDVTDAIKKFEEIKKDYRNLLGVNPCLIIQISNKDRADEELSNKIMPAINKTDLKWMLIVDDDKSCKSNDEVQKLPVAKWKDYAKSNNALIDIIIFKMVITEGWDIPRACMLYQVRNTQSKQLDEQVIGRVRRNPRLLDFETLTEKAQQLAMTAWIWGINEHKKVYGVKLYDEPTDITDNIKVKITKLKDLTEKIDFDLAEFLKKQNKANIYKDSIFDLARKLKQAENEVRDMIYSYATDYTKWWEAAKFTTEIAAKNKEYKCDYVQSMEVADTEVSFTLSSHYTDNGNYIIIGNWVWKRKDSANKFSFDSDAEKDWADILKELSQKAFTPITIGKIKKKEYAGSKNLLGEIITDTKINEKEIFLWGKNYVPNSPIKFEYYMIAKHSSYPDFIMKDKFGRIHIFEVKSVNKSNKYNFDKNIYEAKAEELGKCYKQASKITNQIFYLPIRGDKDNWQIKRFYQGGEDTIDEDMFIDFVKTEP